MRSVCRLLRLLPTPLLRPRPHPHPYPKPPSSAADPAQSEFQAHSYVASYIGSSFQ
ncbi:GD19228 [Drosophila simulans]|uniref:GD19228 n=1 Tax=Drosophila simulans TaxID=7240 RepID=B4QUF2_DROSI|nr:GD19228 [Drosophila simulans]